LKHNKKQKRHTIVVLKGLGEEVKMRQITVRLLFLFMLFSNGIVFAQDVPEKRNCKTRAEIRHTHRLEYRAANGTYRGCQVKSDFYFQIKKTNRGSPKKNIEICEEGNTRYSPRIGRSYEICSAK
jgi:hypothetical protein